MPRSRAAPSLRGCRTARRQRSANRSRSAPRAIASTFSTQGPARGSLPRGGFMIACPYPLYIAHRGAGKLAPENTLAAMRAGYALGYRMVEFDVKLSGDGVPFLLHDDTLDRTTSGHGRADALTWAELSKLDAGGWHSPAFAGEPLPMLEQVARWAIANDVACNIEIKPVPGCERATGAAVALDALALWRGS